MSLAVGAAVASFEWGVLIRYRGQFVRCKGRHAPQVLREALEWSKSSTSAQDAIDKLCAEGFVAHGELISRLHRAAMLTEDELHTCFEGSMVNAYREGDLSGSPDSTSHVDDSVTETAGKSRKALLDEEIAWNELRTLLRMQSPALRVQLSGSVLPGTDLSFVVSLPTQNSDQLERSLTYWYLSRHGNNLRLQSAASCCSTKSAGGAPTQSFIEQISHSEISTMRVLSGICSMVNLAYVLSCCSLPGERHHDEETYELNLDTISLQRSTRKVHGKLDDDLRDLNARGGEHDYS